MQLVYSGTGNEFLMLC